MKRIPLVYLSGQIADISREDASSWRKDFSKLHMNVLDPMRHPFDAATDWKEIVEADKDDILFCDVVVVRYTAPSVGTAMEILFAYGLGKPIIIWHDGPTHELSPWIRYHSNYFVSSLESAVDHANLF